MKKNHIAKNVQGAAGWRRWSAAIALTTSVIAAIPPSYAQEPTTGQATLNFVGADIESVIKAIGHYTNRTFVIDPRVKGTINLVTEKPVSKAQAFELLTSTLRLQGYSVVTTDGFTKVVPEADAKLQAGPIRRGAAVRGDQIATQIFRLNYESAPNLVTVLRPLISPNNTINANPDNNSLVITDYADNLRRLSKIIASLDAPSSGDMQIIPIKNAIASDIAMMVNRLMEPGGAAPGGAAGGAEANRLMLLADPRTNSVIIRAPSGARANLAKSLIARLDQPTQLPGNVHVVYLRNADAIKLAQTLRAVVASDTTLQQSTTQGSNSQSTPSLSQTSNTQNQSSSTGGLQAPPSSTQQQPTTLSTGGPGGFIQADAATNTLIITASEPVYRNLRAVIDQLDARRAQVYIESLIVEVSDTAKAQLGIQWAGVTGNSDSSVRVGTITGFSTGGDNLINQALTKLSNNMGTAAAFAAPSNGLSLAIFNKNGLGLLAHALAADTGSKILSMPNLITLDNEEAKILVGSNVPFVTGQYTTSASGSSNPFQTVERRDIGVVLRVRPQISEGGTVKMAIYQETSAITDATNPAGIITSKRSIETNVLVDDRQLIVLGGLIGDDGESTTEQVPGLGSLPIIGGLFKYRSRSRAKTNLMVFLRPIVIRSKEDSVDVMADRYNYIRNEEIHYQPDDSGLMPKTGSGSFELPSLDQNGQPMDGTLIKARPSPSGETPQAKDGQPTNGTIDARSPSSGETPQAPAPTPATTQ
jgi:general secretion pathway protein D